jgi:deoxyribodipyrimidine photo-lyase
LISRLLTVKSLSSMPKSKHNVRIELFFKDEQELRQRLRFLSSKGVKSFNLVNKTTRDTLQEWVDAIRDEIPDSSVCVHYSAKYNKSRKKDGAISLFQCFMEDMDRKEGDNDVLLITGSGEKGSFNSLSGLQRIQSPYSTPIAVAFNPFFPTSKDVETEKDRLLGKLATQQVKKVYLQFGTDLQRLRESLGWLAKLRSDHDFDICGSIFLPSKRLISQQKFRPWNGVFLNEPFLESEEGARGVVLEMMRLYESYNCEILFEAPGVRNEKDMAIVESLLADRDAGTSPHMQTSNEEEPREWGNNEQEGVKKRRIERLAPSPLVQPGALQKPAIVLFGSFDVRIHDNEAFQLASFHASVIPVFIWCKKDQRKWGVRGASEVVLKDALRYLDSTLSASGLKLVCRSTDNFSHELSRLCEESETGTVYWNREHTPESRIREDRSKTALESIGVQAIECQSSLLYDPSMLSLSGGFQGGHWGTLMPFLKGCRKQLGEPRRPIQRHETFALLQKVQGPKSWSESTPIDCLDMAVVKGGDKWDDPIQKRFPMSEDDALKSMNDFFARGFRQYEEGRSRADADYSTSKLSAHLRIGTMSPNELYYKVEDSDLEYEERKTFSRRLFWRDLAYFQLLNFPKMRETSIRTHYDQTEWVTGEEEKRRFEAWKWGKTGYPLVDAGMRELYATGWMTQSVRMVVASFLTEYLRVNWTKGCEWFHYTLVDADSAINAMMWQNAGRKLNWFSNIDCTPYANTTYMRFRLGN